jgi:Tc toxin complex TcA C-terminal TcB-binding domain
VIRRDPELVALTSPMAATGVFELDAQADMLFPFESMGVATDWELQMPRAGNPFDFTSIADVLVCIEYTALHNPDYHEQVVQRLNSARQRGGERAFSLRREYPDQWYALHNPESTTAVRSIKFSLDKSDFPSQLDRVSVDQLVLYMPSTNGSVPSIGVTIHHANQGGEAHSLDGVISTRHGNATAWQTVQHQSPVGEWDLTFDLAGAGAKLLDDDQLADVLFIVSYTGTAPAWPA